MKSAVLAVVALLFAAVWIGGASAAMVGDASVSYSADRMVTVNGRSYHGRLFHAPGHERHEQELVGREIFILDVEAERGWVVLPSLKTYVEFPFPPVMAALATRGLTDDPVREEVINGVRTTKYRIDREVENTGVDGFLWVSADNILMKFEIHLHRPGHSKPLTIGMELSQLRRAPQDPHLFELPHGLAKLPAEALVPLLGSGR